MKVFLAVFICKILYFIGTRIGRGSSLPGKIVLKLFPEVLRQLKLPEIIIAITGSNGKTTTTELIVHALKASGKSVGWNHEGSNQTEGIATLLLRESSLSGKVKCDAIVMECDERYAKKIFENVKPTALLVTNLCRDQLTRNGHPEFIEDCIRSAITTAGNGMQLVLNTDDPYVSTLARQGDGDISSLGLFGTQRVKNSAVLWFGVCQGDGGLTTPGMYDDGAFCPVCKERMTYSYRIAGHYGNYNCSACGFKRNEPDVAVSIKEDAFLSFGNDIEMKVKRPGITNAYNFCAAVATVKAVGVSISDSVNALNEYDFTSGRVSALPTSGSDDLLLLSKHENSFAYDCSLTWIIEQKKPCTVIIMVNAISRKYYTSETSWLWDIDFDLLADENVKCIVLAGRYVNELAARFAMSKVEWSKITLVDDLDTLSESIDINSVGCLYAVTCFSDKVKLLKALGK